MRRHLLYMGLMALAPFANSQSLPYNPSNIFLRPNSNIAYIFRPSSHSPNEEQLFSYDYSKGFVTPTSSFTTVSESLPFLGSRQNAGLHAHDRRGWQHDGSCRRLLARRRRGTDVAI